MHPDIIASVARSHAADLVREASEARRRPPKRRPPRTRVAR